MSRGKRLHTVSARVDDPVLLELDMYQRKREAEARIPLKRGLVVLEILDRWANEQRAKREQDEASARARGSR